MFKQPTIWGEFIQGQPERLEYVLIPCVFFSHGFTIFILRIWVFASKHMHVHHLPSWWPQRKRRMSELLVLVLQMVLSHHVGPGNETVVFCKGRKCSWILSHQSSLKLLLSYEQLTLEYSWELSFALIVKNKVTILTKFASSVQLNPRSNSVSPKKG